MSEVKVLFRSPIPFLSLVLVPHPVCSLVGIPQLWNLQHLGVSKAIQASPSQPHVMASRPPCRDTCLTSVAFLGHGRRFHKQALSCIFDSKARIALLKLASPTAWWNWNLDTSFNYIHTSFLLVAASFLPKLFFPFTSWKLSWWGLTLRLLLLLFHLSSGFSFVTLNTRLSSITFPGAPYLLKVYISHWSGMLWFE